jgi:diamine N-acetyltransferase
MQKVTLREITKENFNECISLKVAPGQDSYVAPNVFSLAQAKVNPLLTPLAIYDDRIRGHEPDAANPMLGFVMYQIMDGVGFILRLMIAEKYQNRGYGKAAMVEVLRRLKMKPEIEYIGTSVLKGNHQAEKLYRDLGFVDGDKIDERELYLKLNWDPK